MALNILLVEQADSSWALKIKCSDSEVFNVSLAAFKSEVAATYRKFDFVQKCWVIAADSDEHLERYLAMMRARFAAEVTFTDTGAGQSKQGEEHEGQEQQAGHRKSRSAGGEREGKREQRYRDNQPRMNVGRAYDVLYLQAGAPLQLIQAAYKALAKLHHPDVVGGSGATMAEINNAYDVLIRKLSTAAA